MATSESTISGDDYRKILRHRLHSLKKTTGNGFNTQNMAAQCRVQRTYLSRVLNQSAHFNEDQLFLALKFLKFNTAERAYLDLLHQYQRSVCQERQKQLQAQLQVLRNQQQKADQHLELIPLPVDEENFYLRYYLNPVVQLTHVFLTLPQFQNNPTRIKHILNLSDQVWTQTIETLIDLRLLKNIDDRLIAQKSQIFLSSKSPMFNTYHILAKSMAQSQLTHVSNEQKNSVSVIFTCSAPTRRKIRHALIQFIKDVESLVNQDDAPSEVHQLSLDLFPWSISPVEPSEIASKSKSGAKS